MLKESQVETMLVQSIDAIQKIVDSVPEGQKASDEQSYQISYLIGGIVVMAKICQQEAELKPLIMAFKAVVAAEALAKVV